MLLLLGRVRWPAGRRALVPRTMQALPCCSALLPVTHS